MALHILDNADKLVAKKFGFFCDYFSYCCESIGTNDLVTYENPLSLIEKTITQIETNYNHCTIYITEYLKNPILRYRYLGEFSSFKPLKPLIENYKKTPKECRHKWIESNSDFLIALKVFRDQLKEDFFIKTLKEINSFLKCTHELDHHKSDITTHTKDLVSEFLLSGHSKKDLRLIFRKIFSKDLNFPFPPHLLDENETVKYEYINNLDFDKQVLGIHNELNKKLQSNYFIFRIENLKVDTDFEFIYNKVKFISAKNEILTKIINDTSLGNFNFDFFDESIEVIALVNIEYYSVDIAHSKALEFAIQGLNFINACLKVNASIDPYQYFQTVNFEKICGWHGDHRRKSYKIEKEDLQLLNENIYTLLIDSRFPSKDELLKHELIYMNAFRTKNPANYWQYLEAMMPIKNKSKIIDAISEILLLNAEWDHKSDLDFHIFNLIHMISVRTEHLGITKEQHIKYHNRNEVDFQEMNKEIKHPFINHLLNDYLLPFTKNDYLIRKHHYKRILFEAQSERNFFYHQGANNEKSLMLLEETLPHLVTRLRILIIQGIEEHSNLTFKDLIAHLRKKGKELIQ